MAGAKSKKGSHKRKAVAQTVDDSSPQQPPDNKQKLDDITADANDKQAAASEDTADLQRTSTEPPASELTPVADAAPSRSTSNQATGTAVSSTPQPPAIPAHLAYLPPCPIRLSTFDCARKLRLSPNHQSILGDKGYRTCRATHGLSAGSLYFELTYMPTPSAFPSHPLHSTATTLPRSLPPPAVRVGFSTLSADIDGCVGMDRWGYGASSRGWRGHEGVWEEWEGGEWQAGDVIGVYLTLGAEEARGMRGNDADGADGAGGRAGGGRGRGRGSRGRPGKRSGKGRTKAEMAAMYEKELQQRYERREREREEQRERDNSQSHKPQPTTATTTSPSLASTPATTEQDKVALLLSQQKATIFFLASSLRFYRNGQPLSASPAFSNLFRGTYYPTVSLYMYAEVGVNFGPHFQHCPADVSGCWYEKRVGEDDAVAVGEGVDGGGGSVLDEEERSEKLRWLQEERMEELRDRGLLRQYTESSRAALIDNNRHVQLKLEKDREKEDEEREKERRQREKEERERKERMDKEREKELREQRDRDRQAGLRRGGNTNSVAAAVATQEK